MRLNLNDPKSIADWYKLAPARHAGYLRLWLKSEMFAEFRTAIKASRELIK